MNKSFIVLRFSLLTSCFILHTSVSVKSAPSPLQHSAFIIYYSTFNLAALSTQTNPYYVSTEGKAELNNGEMITGKFYYHQPPVGEEDSFYFYPSDIKSLRIIPITDVKKAWFINKKKESVEFNLVGRKLQRTLADGTTQVLITSVLRHIGE